MNTHLIDAISRKNPMYFSETLLLAVWALPGYNHVGRTLSHVGRTLSLRTKMRVLLKLIEARRSEKISINSVEINKKRTPLDLFALYSSHFLFYLPFWKTNCFFFWARKLTVAIALWGFPDLRTKYTRTIVYKDKVQNDILHKDKWHKDNAWFRTLFKFLWHDKDRLW